MNLAEYILRGPKIETKKPPPPPKKNPTPHNEKGEKLCGKCAKWLPTSEYNKNRARWDKLAHLCRECERVAKRLRYHGGSA